MPKHRAAAPPASPGGHLPKAFQEYAEAGYRELNPQDRSTADIRFDDRYEFSIGGLDGIVIGQMGAETNDSLIV